MKTNEEIALEHKRTYNREYSKNKRASEQEFVTLSCHKCGCDVPTKKYLLSKYKTQKRYCKKCISEKSSDRFKKYKKSLSVEERSQEGKIGSKSKSSECKRNAVIKQWKTIKDDIVEFEKVKNNHKKRMIEVWKNYSEEKRNFILTALVESNGNKRSKLSDDVKKELIKHNLYDNFVSEECFCGFFPDEINHKIKLIIEVYGDQYHCNPKKFLNSKEYVTLIERTVEEQWLRDKRRLACFYQQGYQVIIIWESDWHNNPIKQIERIKEVIDKRNEEYFKGVD